MNKSWQTQPECDGSEMHLELNKNKNIGSAESIKPSLMEMLALLWTWRNFLPSLLMTK